MKNLMMFISLSLLFIAHAQSQDTTHVFINYELQPQLIGGYDSLIEANISLLWLPEGCSEEGKSYVQFIVQKDGSIKDVKVIKGLDNCSKADSIAIEIVKTVNFLPGRYKNEVVGTHRVLPIPFYKRE
ncbi:hypothetical protein GCM10011506_26300 [Marivirga lumbricoides]|uniref:TonB C-terminal domain-containing protein n=1 Tax=Marivirga lumbricoides TaxID=1046115 RepID=A0ABQ1MF97_9BACT|nr:hypothetical protein GCM10011506_26300 [Marivirga lumbricoides]